MPSSSNAAAGPSKPKKGSSSGSKDGKLSSRENHFYNVISALPGKHVTNDDLAARFPDFTVQDQMHAINELSERNLLKTERVGSTIRWVAVPKAQASLIGKLDPDEQLVYNAIRDSSNEGIWSKHIKDRTKLHQTVANKCLKALEGQRIIKTVKSVKHPTRKIYMLYELQPSTDISGGPWYTDTELDTEFIEQMCETCYRYIAECTWPSSGERLFPSFYQASRLPMARDIQRYIRKSRMSNIDLELDHIIQILNILIYDGRVEKFPFLLRVPREHDDAERKEQSKKSKKKRKRKEESTEEEEQTSPAEEEDDEEEDEEEEAEESDASAPPKKKATAKDKGKKNLNDIFNSEDSDDDVPDMDDAISGKSAKKKKGSAAAKKAPPSKKAKTAAKAGAKSTGKGKAASKKRSSRSRSNSDSGSESEDGTDADAASDDGSEEEEDPEAEWTPKGGRGADLGSDFVYRAVQRMRADYLGGTQVPCGHCAVFDFCAKDGPTNAEECKYYDDWLKVGQIAGDFGYGRDAFSYQNAVHAERQRSKAESAKKARKDKQGEASDGANAQSDADDGSVAIHQHGAASSANEEEYDGFDDLGEE